MNYFEVGKPYSPAFGLGEGVRFNLASDGAAMIYAFDNPTPDEIDQMHSGNGFEIRFVTLGGIIWIMSKCGNLEWTDAPYNPRLSSSLPELPSGDTEGTALTLVMLNSRDAVVKSVRLIGLGTEFSRRLISEATALRNMTMTVKEAAMSINQTMAKYSTKDLIKMAPGYARFRL